MSSSVKLLNQNSKATTISSGSNTTDGGELNGK